MLNKNALGLMALITVGLCYGFAVEATRKQEERLTVVKSAAYVEEAPIAILNATRDAEHLSVEIQNQSAFPVEFFELHIGKNRITVGRNTATEKITKAKGFDQVPVLSFPSQEIRTFTFPPPKDPSTTISIELVLLANGQGWFQGVRLKRLDTPRKGGMLWDIDDSVRTPRVSQSRKANTPKGFTTSIARSNNCYLYDSFDFYDCTEGPGPDPGGCGFFGITWAYYVYGTPVNFFRSRSVLLPL